MQGYNFIGMPSVIGFHKCDIRFDPNLRVMLDCEFYYLLYKKYGLPGHIKNKLIAMRYHDNSTSRKQGNQNYLAQEVEYLKLKHAI